MPDRFVPKRILGEEIFESNKSNSLIPLMSKNIRSRIKLGW
jgi:hypothetical protein